MKQYFVDEDVVTLGAFLERMGETDALADGRVFLLEKRMGASDLGRSLRKGERVTIGSRERGKEGITSGELLPILFEDANYVAVSKPSGISTVPDLSSASDSLVHRVAALSSIAPNSLFHLRDSIGKSAVSCFLQNRNERTSCCRMPERTGDTSEPTWD